MESATAGWKDGGAALGVTADVSTLMARSPPRHCGAMGWLALDLAARGLDDRAHQELALREWEALPRRQVCPPGNPGRPRHRGVLGAPLGCVPVR